MELTSTPQPARAVPLRELLGSESPPNLRDRLLIFRNVVCELEQLHSSGITHRAIDDQTVRVSDNCRVHVDSAPAERLFGGDFCDPEFSPPTLTGKPTIRLVADIAEARRALQAAGLTIAPEQIDLYQLGVLLWQLLTGDSIRDCIFHPGRQSVLPAEVQPLLRKLLGFDGDPSFADCPSVLTAVDQALEDLAPTRPSPTQGTGLPRPTEGDLPFLSLGHYRIIERIGHGGMGEVYRAHDESLDRTVAIKLLPAQLARHHDFVARFRSEATAVASLNHPNIVPIYSIDQIDDHLFFVMQLVDGESLSQRLKRSDRLPLAEAVRLTIDCLSGLEAAHERGLIHRDLKPANILIDDATGRAMLADFGLVRRLGDDQSLTLSGVILGTVDYISPEQAQGLTIDGRADLYAIGVLLYRMLSGSLPFEAETPSAVIYQHVHQAPRSLQLLHDDVPDALAVVVARLMEKRPEDRHQSVAQVLDDLRRIHHVLVESEDTATALRLLSQPRRHSLATVILAAFAVTLGGILLSLVVWGQGRWWGRSPEINAADRPTSSESLEGIVFRDLDGNGIRGVREPGVPGCRLVLHRLGVPVLPVHTLRFTGRSFGQAVAVAQDRVALTALRVPELDDLGAACSFNIPTGSRLGTLTSKATRPGDRFGFSVAMNEELVVVGAPYHDIGELEDAGAAFLYAVASGKLLQTYHSPSPSAGDRFGYDVALVGNDALVGAPNDDTVAEDAGVVYRFASASGQAVAKLLCPDAQGNEIFGTAIAVLGEAIFVGAPRALPDSVCGVVYRYDRLDPSATPLSEKAYANPEPPKDLSQSDNFGSALSAKGDWLAVGDIFDDQAGNNAGLVYLFKIKTGRLQQTFSSQYPQDEGHFGHSVDIVGKNILVGAPMEDQAGFDAGAAYLFDGATGICLTSYENPAPATEDRFGWDLAATDDHIVITTPKGGHLGLPHGEAYVFKRLPRPIAATTDDHGRYLIEQIEPGSYRVSLKGNDDSETVLVNHVEISSGDEPTTLDLPMPEP